MDATVLLRRAAMRWRDRPAVALGERTLATFAELEDRAGRLAGAFAGRLEKLMHNIGMFDRETVYSDLGEGKGHDFMARYKKYILDGKTLVCSPHKIYGPEQNDLALQLRKQHVDQVILAGMSANLCVESHLRELLEMGFEVGLVRDATAAAKLPEGDGYMAAIINFRFIANALWTTDEVVAMLSA